MLFLIYVNDLDDYITSKLLKFAGDMELFKRLQTFARGSRQINEMN